MKLKRSEPLEEPKGKTRGSTKQKSEERVKLGKRSKLKGDGYERAIAKIFGAKYNINLKRTPQSGGFAKKSEKADDFRGDITVVDDKIMLLLHLECKNQKTWALPAWIKQAEEDCPEGRVPVIVIHKHNTSKDYVVLSLDDFLEMTPKDKVVGRRKFN